jgi:rhodanese-related sulfurtransferase
MAKTAKQFLEQAKSQIEEISTAQLKAKIDSGQDDFLVVDVRETPEFNAGHIPNAIHAPRGFLEFHLDMASGMGNPKLDTDKTMVMVCGSGGRSALAAHTASQMGKRVQSLAGGFKGWKEAGFDTTNN